MAYHIECKPEAQNDPNFAVFDSKYSNPCAGCKNQIEIGDKIAFYKKGQGSSSAGSPPASKDHSSELASLKAAVVELKQKVNRLEQIEANQSGYIAFLANVDWRKIPKLESPEPKPTKPATPKQAETILKGKDVSTEVVAVQTEIVEDAY